MTRVSVLQNVFSSGEISPRLHHRIDFQRFQTGVQAANGFVPTRQGAITRAPGTLFWGRTRQDAFCRLLPFEFSAEDAVLLEFYAGIMRVRRYGELVMDGAQPYELAHPFEAQDLPNLSWVQSADVIYIADGRRPIQRLSRFALDHWTIEAQPIDTGPFRLRNTDEAKAVTASAETGSVTLTASADLFLPGHVGSLFSMEPVDWTDVAIWTQDTPITAGTTRMRYDGKLYLATAGANTGFVPPQHERGTQKVDQETGATWQYLSDGRGVLRITAVASPTSATAQVIRRIPIAGSATWRWAEGAWSDVYGYPAQLELYDQRFIAAASESEPRTVWLSAAGGGYADFAEGERPDDAFALIIDGDGSQNPVQWLARGDRALHIGALNEEYSLRSEGRNTIVAATTARLGMDSKIGGAPLRPIAPDGAPIFISRDGAKVFEIRYVIEHDANVSVELSLPSDHLGEAGFDQVVWQSAPWRMAWLRRGDGSLACLLHDRQENVLGWAPLTLAGGVVEDIAVTPSICHSMDLLVMVITRAVGGQLRRHIEVQAAPHGVAMRACNIPPAHLYSAVVHSGEAQQDFNLSHLVGETVEIWTSEGRFEPQVVPHHGTVTLPEPVTLAEIGLFDHTHFLETLDLQAAAPDGSPWGRRKKLSSLGAIGLHRSQGGFVQAVARELGEAPRLGAQVPLVKTTVGNDPAQFFSGIVRPDLNVGVAREIGLRFTPYSGAALTLTALSVNLQEQGA
ncbi:MAG: hypothetical protein ACK4LQ_02090 [Pararhodobacter sp.]